MCIYVVYLLTHFQVPRPNGSLIILIRPKAKEIFGRPKRYLTIYRKVTLQMYIFLAYLLSHIVTLSGSIDIVTSQFVLDRIRIKVFILFLLYLFNDTFNNSDFV
jgi:hypothetical protein